MNGLKFRNGPGNKFCLPPLVLAILWLLVSPSQAEVVQSVRHGDVFWSLHDTPARLLRFDLQTRQWLPELPLPPGRGTAGCFHVDDDGIYVAYDKAVYRYHLSGGSEAHLINTPDKVHAIHTDGHLLFVNHSVLLYVNMTSIHKITNTVIDTVSRYIHSVHGSYIVPTANRIVGRSMGISPSDITYIDYTDSGTFANNGDSPYHGEYPGASRAWGFPNDQRVVDSAGIVYSTNSLNHLGSFGGVVNDIAFHEGSLPVVLRGNRLIAHNASLEILGSRSLGYSPFRIAIHGGDVITFTKDALQAPGLLVHVLPLAQLNLPEAAAPTDPSGLAYTPDYVFKDANGIVLLIHKGSQSIFRWDPFDQRYLETVPLAGIPKFVAYSPNIHSLYLAYPNRVLSKMDLSAPTPVEQLIHLLPTTPIGLATAGSYAFVATEDGTWDTFRTITPAGVQAASRTLSRYSHEYVWSEVNQKMYHLRDGTSPNDLHSQEINASGSAYAPLEAGGFGTNRDSPLHNSTGFTHPIRVSADGSKVALSSGRFFDGQTLALDTAVLANSYTDAAWLGSNLRTMRTISGLTQYQPWNSPTWSQGTAKQYPGTAHRLLALDESRMVGISILADGIPSLYVLNDACDMVPPASLAQPGRLRITAKSATRVDLAWADGAGESAYEVHRKTGTGGIWAVIGGTSTSATTYADQTAAAGNTYFYRIVARNNTLASPPSSEVSVSLTPPAAPTGLAASQFAVSAILLSWQPVGNVTGYKIQRSDSSSGPWSQIATAAADAVAFLNTPVMGDTTYHYRVIASNELGDSAPSAVASGLTPALAPAATYLTTATVGYDKIQLRWGNMDNEHSYVLEKFQDGSWNILATLPANTTTYTDDGLSAQTEYMYRIKVLNVAGASSYDMLTVTTLKHPPHISPVADQTYSIGTPVSLPILLDDPAAKVSVSGLPSGLTYSATTGSITGVPRKAGRTQVTIRASTDNVSFGQISFFLQVDPLPLRLTGAFAGLLTSHSELVPQGGSISLKAAPGGGTSISLLLGSSKISLKTVLQHVPGESFGSIATPVSRGRDLASWTLRLLLPDADEMATGTLEDAGGTLLATVSLVRQQWDFNVPVTAEGRYHLAFTPTASTAASEAPAGFGYAIFSVRKAGAVTWTAELADGTKCTGKSFLGVAGDMPLYHCLYKTSGSIAGWLKHEKGDSTGTLRWAKAWLAESKDKLYPQGFPALELEVSGGRYTPPAKDQPLLTGLAAAQENLLLLFEEIDDSESFNQAATLTEKNSLSVPANLRKVGCRLTANTGLFNGSFEWRGSESDNLRIAKFKGCLIPGEAGGLGFFHLPESQLTSGLPAAKSLLHSGKVGLLPNNP